MNWVKNILLTIGSIAVSFYAGLYVLEITGNNPKIESGWVWKNSPLRSLQPQAADNEINELGLRGQPFNYSNDDFVVLLVGDSQVEAANSEQAQMPELILQEELTKSLGKPTRVFSLAASGWGQDQQFLALHKYFDKHRADMVVVWATPGNDFWENTFPDRSINNVAGPFKPTFKLEDGDLRGPFFSSDFYYKDSAIRHLYIRILERFGLQDRLEDALLNEWIASLPPAISIDKNKVDCGGTQEINQVDFYKNIFDIDKNKKYTVEILENLSQSRSQFSPYTTPSTYLDDYEKQITKALFSKMALLSNMKGSKFKVFYPLREDFDQASKAIKCVKTMNQHVYYYSPDFEGLLKKTVDMSDLIIFEIAGKNEIVVSKTDRHLNYIGNKLVMTKLASKIANVTFN